MATYVGKRDENNNCVVTKKGKKLPLKNNIINHSPTGYEWGYQGSGPAALSLAIVYDRVKSEDRAVRLHQEFKRRLVATLPQEGWTLTEEEVDQVIKEIEEDEA